MTFALDLPSLCLAVLQVCTTAEWFCICTVLKFEVVLSLKLWLIDWSFYVSVYPVAGWNFKGFMDQLASNTSYLYIIAIDIRLGYFCVKHAKIRNKLRLCKSGISFRPLLLRLYGYSGYKNIHAAYLMRKYCHYYQVRKIKAIKSSAIDPIRKIKTLKQELTKTIGLKFESWNCLADKYNWS